MTETQTQTKPETQAQISKSFLEEFAEASGLGDFILDGTIKPGELHDILACISKLKQDTGWGRIELHYKASDLDEHIVAIKGKRTKEDPLKKRTLPVEV